jgi:membrane protein implicated in regulation of membrane protease activity
MSGRGWSPRVVVRYVLFQVPAILILVLVLIPVGRWVDLPAWFVWGLIGFWVVKDVILFPFVWSAYDLDRPGNTNSIVGSQGIAEDRLAPSGYIRVHGELWKAEVIGGSPPVERGEAVRVRGINGLTALVQADNRLTSMVKGNS